MEFHQKQQQAWVDGGMNSWSVSFASLCAHTVLKGANSGSHEGKQPKHELNSVYLFDG